MVGPRRQKVCQGDASSGSDSTSESASDDQELEDKLETESWVEWVRRTTDVAENALKKIHIHDWVAEQKKRLWRFAGHTVRRTDGRWNTLLLRCQPQK